jgi:hypothetical protein
MEYQYLMSTSTLLHQHRLWWMPWYITVFPSRWACRMLFTFLVAAVSPLVSMPRHRVIRLHSNEQHATGHVSSMIHQPTCFSSRTYRHTIDWKIVDGRGTSMQQQTTVASPNGRRSIETMWPEEMLLSWIVDMGQVWKLNRFSASYSLRLSTATSIV